MSAVIIDATPIGDVADRDAAIVASDAEASNISAAMADRSTRTPSARRRLQRRWRADPSPGRASEESRT
jgi:hypothetical protein